MQTLETLSGMLETTDDIQSIVRTMKSLSAVSIRQYERAEASVSDYARTIDFGLTALFRDRRAQRDAFRPIRAGNASRRGLVVIGSDRGLCGRYNEVVARTASARMADGVNMLAVIGARAAARLDAEGHGIDRLFLLPGSVAGLTPLVGSVLVEIDRWMRECDVGTVSVIHNRREGRSRAVPTERALLPIPNDEMARLTASPWPGPGLPFFRMDRSRLLSWLVRQRFLVLLYQALAEGLASEHATRLAAMQSAERNIQERKDALMSSYRRKRQEEITRELLDVVSGFEAVSTDSE